MYTVLFFVFAPFVQLDPLIMVYKYWIPLHFKDVPGFQVVFHAARFLQLIPVVLAFFTICRVICFGAVVINAIMGCIFFMEGSVKDISNFWAGPAILLKHKGLEIIFGMWNAYLGPVIAISLFASGLLIVLLNFISLKMYSAVPFRMYAFFPTIAVLVTVVIYMFMPMVIAVFERDVEIHAKWRYYSYRSSNVKLLLRRLRATKVIGITVGIANYRLFDCTKSMLPRYFSVTVDYTITALLSIPVNV